MARPIERVLIYRLGSLGDTVVALPAMHLVARTYPQAERRLLTNYPIQVKAPPAAAVLEGAGLVHGYMRYAVGTRSPRELLALWWSLVRWRPQVLIYLAPARGVAAARRDALFFRLCGISKMIGVPSTESAQRNEGEPGGDLEPEAARLARTLRWLGDARIEEAASWSLSLSQTETARAAEVLEREGGAERPLIAVSIGTKLQANDWGRENWAALLERLARVYPDYALALTGAAVDREYSEEIAEGWRRGAGGQRGPAINLCGLLTPRESAAVFARARVYLGHDSGPMHLAAAVGTPCVAIFSARGLPRVWFPYGRRHRVIYHRVECAGCGLETCIAERKRCLTSISVTEVAGEVDAVLGPPGLG